MSAAVTPLPDPCVPASLPPEQFSHPFDVERLRAYLSTEKLPGSSAPLAVHQFTHGQSNPTYLLEAGSHHYVLRRKPPGALLMSAHAIDREFRVMQALFDSDVPVPRMHCYCADEGVIGTAFYVMEYVDGRIFKDVALPGLSVAERGAVYDELNRVIAALHSVDPAAVSLSDFGKPTGYVARQIARWTNQYRASQTCSIPAMDQLIDWLPHHLPPEEPACLAHGDFRLDNVIFHASEPRIVAVIDWELATLGDALADFSYHCITWCLPPELGASLVGYNLAALGIPSNADYVRRYCDRTGRQSIAHFEYYTAFGIFRLAAILQGVAARAAQGSASSSKAAEAGARAAPMAQFAWDVAQGCKGALSSRAAKSDIFLVDRKIK